LAGHWKLLLKASFQWPGARGICEQVGLARPPWPSPVRVVSPVRQSSTIHNGQTTTRHRLDHGRGERLPVMLGMITIRKGSAPLRCRPRSAASPGNIATAGCSCSKDHPVSHITQCTPQPSYSVRQGFRRIHRDDGKARCRGFLPTIGACHSTSYGSAVDDTRHMQQIGR
jgi:hypothetical protein